MWRHRRSRISQSPAAAPASAVDDKKKSRVLVVVAPLDPHQPHDHSTPPQAKANLNAAKISEHKFFIASNIFKTSYRRASSPGGSRRAAATVGIYGPDYVTLNGFNGEIDDSNKSNRDTLDSTNIVNQKPHSKMYADVAIGDLNEPTANKSTASSSAQRSPSIASAALDAFQSTLNRALRKSSSRRQ